MTPPRRSTLQSLLATLALVAGTARTGRGEAAVSYKYEDYQESGGRIGVQTQGALLEGTIGTATTVRVGGVIDAIAGATPNGQRAPAGSDQVVLTSLTERRKAWNAEMARQFPRLNAALGVAHSREGDYVSTAFSLNTLTDFNQKNTTLLAGAAVTTDDIKAFYQFPSPVLGKRTLDVIVGATQVLDPRTSVSFNVTFSRAHGYLNDQYKLVQKATEIVPGIFLPLTFPENRPDRREKWITLATVNRAFPDVRAALEGSYRFFHDNFGIASHTLSLTWLQRVGSRVTLEPLVRWYRQDAARFYYYNLDQTPIVPVFGAPRPQGPFYSSDYRLSALDSLTLGLKVSWRVSDRLEINAAWKDYDLQGRDGATPASAYSQAVITSAGLKFSW